MNSPSENETGARPWRRWPILVLLAILAFDAWYRAHTFAAQLPGPLGSLCPAAKGPSEPLDCDETAYAYMGHRMLRGDVLYRDLAEHKPPLGYWIYELAVALGGYDELAVRLLPLPFVLGTITLLWWLGLRIAGPSCGCLAAAIFAVASTDPYLYGNGSNMEHFMNFFSVAALALFVRGRAGHRRWAIAAAGACVGASALVKQVAIVPAAVFAVAVLLKPGEGEADARTPAARLLDGLIFGIGLAAAIGLAALALWLQGAGISAIDEIFRYGPALATDTLPEPNAPPGLIRWLTGNAAPDGKLPWPFGRTDYLVWWGTGSWPIWLATAAGVAYLLTARGVSSTRRLVAAWTVASALQVILPGLYWQHYYLLVTPGIALTTAVALVDSLGPLVRSTRRTGSVPRAGAGRIAASIFAAGSLSLAIAATVVLQVRCYLLVPPQELTVRYKGGGQWVALRAWGEELDRRRSVWADPRLYIWGYQAPLHFYGKLDGVTRYFFVDNLLRDQAERDHPLIRPRIEEIVASLRAKPPSLIFVGYPPFPALRAFLRERYRPSSLIPGGNGMGLWVDGEHHDAFEAAGSRGRAL
ncbi:Undecaprenyl phosphate-alpha-4-amino-4-deoxy-L-arabinose arabinosyl transferase [Aquisphaera giovannonii]|uniref:Undecaprenyl phosphate-alpha-4-amino-4-deoxy-L-arabinose arabinosyl transferase n=1 Tax=Aquisphaera giovannonii TaxID=406548 RepID=A0A5B9WDM8_9BACT|nr:glycosyltransferase family 39 protein [Aquisphaera giovannonii]QEH38000.1 Undecaprenyl phosphate-alpha-4-amino-4-deoxy-L-arabinose arabinosyl transferase [Aquisphaera giovannonii]